MKYIQKKKHCLKCCKSFDKEVKTHCLKCCKEIDKKWKRCYNCNQKYKKEYYGYDD